MRSVAGEEGLVHLTNLILFLGLVVSIHSKGMKVAHLMPNCSTGMGNSMVGDEYLPVVVCWLCRANLIRRQTFRIVNCMQGL